MIVMVTITISQPTARPKLKAPRCADPEAERLAAAEPAIGQCSGMLRGGRLRRSGRLLRSPLPRRTVATASASALALQGRAAAAGLRQTSPEEIFPNLDEAIAQHFVFGTLEAHGVLRCSYWLDSDRTEAWLVADVGRGAGNMSGAMMGGAAATLLDQGCGLLFSSKHRGATAYLNIQYRAPTPVPGAVVVKARLDRVSGRKLWINATLECAAAEGLA